MIITIIKIMITIIKIMITLIPPVLLESSFLLKTFDRKTEKRKTEKQKNEKQTNDVEFASDYTTIVLLEKVRNSGEIRIKRRCFR